MRYSEGVATIVRKTGPRKGRKATTAISTTTTRTANASPFIVSETRAVPLKKRSDSSATDSKSAAPKRSKQKSLPLRTWPNTP